jgi:hypothetical protein
MPSSCRCDACTVVALGALEAGARALCGVVLSTQWAFDPQLRRCVQLVWNGPAVTTTWWGAA